MYVRDHMTRNVTTLLDDARLIDAALMIRRTGKRHVPVVSAADGKLVGIISDRDVARLAPSVLTTHDEEEYNRVFESTPITQGMTKEPVTIGLSSPACCSSRAVRKNSMAPFATALTVVASITETIFIVELCQNRER